MRRHSALSVCLNAIVAAVVAVLFGFAIKLKTQLVVVSQDGDGFSTFNITPATWNIGITIIGTVVGVVASIAFSAQDAFLSRMGLVSDRGVAAIFLRPLTTMRGLQQLLRGELNPERTALFILTLGTALMSAATVALLSVQNVVYDVTNTSPSFPLSYYNITQTFFTTNAQGGIFPILLPTDSELRVNVNSFVYRSTFINAQKLAPYKIQSSISTQGLLGETTYGDLWTSGVGINANSYINFPGPSGNFPLPVNYTFASLSGRVYGTTVNVTCENSTSSYSVRNLGQVSTGIMVTASKAGFETGFNTNITMFIAQNDVNVLPMGFNLTYDGAANPIHVILVTDLQGDNAQVFECSYQGREALFDFAISGPADPLVIGEVADQGPVIGPQVKKLIASNLDEIISASGGGSVLSKAFVDANYNSGGDNTTAAFGQVLGTVLSQSAQAIISVLRQPIEVANLYQPPLGQGAYVTMSMKIQRVGGGSYGWLAVYGAVLLGALLGLIRSLIGGKAVAFEAQDAVILLGQALRGKSTRSTTKVHFAEGVGLVHLSHGAVEEQSST